MATLKREISGFGGLLITLSCLSPSLGVFVAGNDVIHQVGSGAFLCFVGAVLLGIAMSAVYAELGSAFPHTGGEYTIAGTVLGPMAGFGMLMTNLVGYSIALATCGHGVADYLRPLLPNLPEIPATMAIIIVVTLISVLSIKVNAWITGLFLGVEILTLLATAAIGYLHTDAHGAALLIHPLVSIDGAALHPVSALAMGIGAVGSIYAFNGYGAVIFLGEEMHDAGAKIGRVVYWALGIAAITELLPMAAIIAGAPDLAKLSASASPVPDFFAALAGPRWAPLLSLAIASAIFNTMIAVCVTGARQLFATGRDRCWPEPISVALEKIHPRLHSPWIATLLLGAIGFTCSLAPTHILLIINGSGNVALYATLAIAVIAGRRNRTTVQTRSPAPFHPLAPLCVLAALAFVVWANFAEPAGLVAEAAILVLGAGYFHFSLRHKPDWALRGPDESKQSFFEKKDQKTFVHEAREAG